MKNVLKLTLSAFAIAALVACGGSDDDATHTPDPVNPDPVNPGPVNPGPVNPGSVNPGSVNPGSVNPGSVNPGLSDPVKTFKNSAKFSKEFRIFFSRKDYGRLAAEQEYVGFGKIENNANVENLKKNNPNATEVEKKAAEDLALKQETDLADLELFTGYLFKQSDRGIIGNSVSQTGGDVNQENNYGGQLQHAPVFGNALAYYVDGAKFEGPKGELTAGKLYFSSDDFAHQFSSQKRSFVEFTIFAADGKKVVRTSKYLVKTLDDSNKIFTVDLNTPLDKDNNVRKLDPKTDFFGDAKQKVTAGQIVKIAGTHYISSSDKANGKKAEFEIIKVVQGPDIFATNEPVVKEHRDVTHAEIFYNDGKTTAGEEYKKRRTKDGKTTFVYSNGNEVLPANVIQISDVVVKGIPVRGNISVNGGLLDVVDNNYTAEYKINTKYLADDAKYTQSAATYLPRFSQLIDNVWQNKVTLTTGGDTADKLPNDSDNRFTGAISLIPNGVTVDLFTEYKESADGNKFDVDVDNGGKLFPVKEAIFIPKKGAPYNVGTIRLTFDKYDNDVTVNLHEIITKEGYHAALHFTHNVEGAAKQINTIILGKRDSKPAPEVYEEDIVSGPGDYKNQDKKG